VKKEPPMPHREVLKLDLQAKLKDALLIAEGLKVEERGQVSANLKTIIGSLSYLRKLAA
jgi:hypothetical protein